MKKIDVSKSLIFSRNIVGTEIPHEMFVELQHEVSHYFNRASNNNKDVLSAKYRKLYSQVTKYLRTKQYLPEEEELLFALYWSFNNEITANIHEMEAELEQHKNDINNKTWSVFFKKTALHDILKTTEKILFLCKTKQIPETEIKKLFGITMNKYIDLIEAGYKKTQDKCGKVLSLFLGENNLTSDYNLN